MSVKYFDYYEIVPLGGNYSEVILVSKAKANNEYNDLYFRVVYEDFFEKDGIISERYKVRFIVSDPNKHNREYYEEIHEKVVEALNNSNRIIQ